MGSAQATGLKHLLKSPLPSLGYPAATSGPKEVRANRGGRTVEGGRASKLCATAVLCGRLPRQMQHELALLKAAEAGPGGKANLGRSQRCHTRQVHPKSRWRSSAPSSASTGWAESPAKPLPKSQLPLLPLQDGSGQIDLNELQALCAELGVTAAPWRGPKPKVAQRVQPRGAFSFPKVGS